MRYKTWAAIGSIGRAMSLRDVLALEEVAAIVSKFWSSKVQEEVES